MPEELALRTNEISQDILDSLNDIKQMFDSSLYDKHIYEEKELKYIETVYDHMEFSKNFSTSLITTLDSINNSLSNISEHNDINVVVSGLNSVENLDDLTNFLDIHNETTSINVEEIDDSLTYLTTGVLPTTIASLEDSNKLIDNQLEILTDMFIDTSETLKEQFEDIDSTVDSYTDSVGTSMTNNVNMIDNKMSNTLGSLGAGLGSFIGEFASKTSNALPILGKNISAFFGALAKPQAIAGIAITTGAIMGLGKGIDWLGDGISEIVESFGEFVQILDDTDNVGDLALDMVKLSGGITTLNLALNLMTVGGVGSYVGLQILTNILDDLGSTYDNNEESLDSMITLLEQLNAMNSMSDFTNFEKLGTVVDDFVANLPDDLEIDLKPVFKMEDIPEVDIVANLKINTDELIDLQSQAKPMDLQVSKSDVLTSDTILNKTENVMNVDQSAILDELRGIRVGIDNISLTNNINTKKTR